MTAVADIIALLREEHRTQHAEALRLYGEADSRTNDLNAIFAEHGEDHPAIKAYRAAEAAADRSRKARDAEQAICPHPQDKREPFLALVDRHPNATACTDCRNVFWWGDR